MAQQLGIVLHIDVTAALRSNKLDGNIYLTDNNRWLGSKGCGSGKLKSAVTDLDRAVVPPSPYVPQPVRDTPLLNWIPYAIGAPTPSVPLAARLKEIPVSLPAAPKSAPDPMADPYANLKIANLAGEETDFEQEIERIRKMEDALKNEEAPDRNAAKKAGGVVDFVFYPPRITNICGEAVQKGVLLPRVYGSPEIGTTGDYWCASVAPGAVGTFKYTMWICLPHIDMQKSYRSGKRVMEYPTMPYDAEIRIGRQFSRNGFEATHIALTPNKEHHHR